MPEILQVQGNLQRGTSSTEFQGLANFSWGKGSHYPLYARLYGSHRRSAAEKTTWPWYKCTLKLAVVFLWTADNSEPSIRCDLYTTVYATLRRKSPVFKEMSLYEIHNIFIPEDSCCLYNPKNEWPGRTLNSTRMEPASYRLSIMINITLETSLLCSIQRLLADHWSPVAIPKWLDHMQDIPAPSISRAAPLGCLPVRSLSSEGTGPKTPWSGALQL
jgi:hypothetical protein